MTATDKLDVGAGNAAAAVVTESESSMKGNDRVHPSLYIAHSTSIVHGLVRCKHIQPM